MFVCMFVCGRGVEVREKPTGVSSLPPLCESLRLNSGHQSWQQAHLYMLSHPPSPITFNLSDTVALDAYSPKGIYPAIRTQSPGTSLKSRWPLFTLHCSASVRRTSVEAEPSRRNRPKVSFSRHMSRIALAVFPVSFREWTNTST